MRTLLLATSISLVTLTAGTVTGPVAAVTSAKMVIFDGHRIDSKRSANRHLVGAPRSLRTFVVHTLRNEEEACGGLRGTAGVAAYHAKGFATGDIDVDGCLGYGAVWMKKHGSWKRLVAIQDSPACKPLRKHHVPRRLFRTTGQTHCYNAAGERVEY